MKAIVIGSGRRVQQDVLPVLCSMNFEEISIYATKNRNILVRDITYKVLDFRLLNYISDEDLIYIAVPPDYTYNVLTLIRRINRVCKVIVDTPIKCLDFWDTFHTENTIVGEDAFYLGNYIRMHSLQERSFNVLISYKSSFSYHGFAFVQGLLGDNELFSFSFSRLILYFNKNGIAICFGSRNYGLGNFWWNFKSIDIPELSKLEYNLIGGLSDYDTLSTRFLEMKRIGLRQLIVDAMSSGLNSVSVKKAYRQYDKTRLFNLSIIQVCYKALRNMKNV